MHSSQGQMSSYTTYYVYTDGASRGNPGPASAGFVLIDDAGNIKEKCGKLLGKQTNNYAEYSAVVLALEKTQEILRPVSGVKLIFKMDSELAVKQLKGEYQVKNPTLAEFFQKIKTLEVNFGGVEYIHIPRSQNKEADKLVNQLLDHK